MRALFLAALLAQSAAMPPLRFEVGQKLAAFRVKDVAGAEFDLASLQTQKAIVLAFVATGCPVSTDYDARLADFAREYAAKDVAVVALFPNRGDDAAKIAAHAKAKGFAFPVLKDEKNAQADALAVQFVPEVLVFDASLTLRYRGRLDEDRAGSAVPAADLKAAVDALLAGREIRLRQTKAFGCLVERTPR
jgi:peroxiredoxin